MIKILLGVTGGISAYKSAELVRLLTAENFSVRVVMTSSAQKFIAPLTFQALSGELVYTDPFDSDAKNGMDHIALAKWADLILIAPATADFIARLAVGRADDLLAMLCTATNAPIAVAPAMNQQMWLNPANQQNIETLKSRGVLCFGPGEGEQACGDVGPGRLLEVETLRDLVVAQFVNPELHKKKIVITAGATQESIDPVRYLTNHSTGLMGYALAEAAHRAGAEVILISGATTLSCSKGIRRIDVRSALDMHKAVFSVIAAADIFVSA
ncbi:MAG: bifunctional phosphopantothenoylcysteine decarboxylase/phosphopantothenate--cysteine ligase CoaBC, partial [Coxiellaceae bacterium]|nr:bifunctional phosphopantothenoylcysteine decarboxylase/phosphopantothenate--cysteine ligase CoaBC [Coxiellaceae bacterium]